MPLRLLEVYVPSSENLSWINEQVEKLDVHAVWTESEVDNQHTVKILVSSEESGELMDIIQKRFSSNDNFRMILLPVEATVPRVESDKKKTENKEEKPKKIKSLGISREELYSDITSGIQTSKVFIFMTILSSIVASIGVLKDNVAVIIGAMVIAPLLAPNVALALSVTLGDIELSKKSIRSNLLGVTIGLIISVSIGYFLYIDPTIHELKSRTEVGLGDIVLALASGSAGALSFTVGLPSALIGVMVAVALLPPLVAFGMLLGAGYFSLAYGALILLLVNVIAVNLSGVITFALQGVRPINWWEADKARKSTYFAIITSTVLLIILIALILFR